LLQCTRLTDGQTENGQISTPPKRAETS